MNSWIPREPARTGLQANNLQSQEADPDISKLIAQLFGCKGKVFWLASPATPPYGFYKFEPENQNPPRFLKILPLSHLEQQTRGNEVAKILKNRAVLVSCILSDFPKILQTDKAVFAYEWIDGRFASLEHSDLEALGKETSRLQDALLDIPFEEEIRVATKKRMDLLENSAKAIMEGKYRHGPFPEWVKNQMQGWKETSCVLEGLCQVIHGDLNIGNVMFLLKTGQPVFLDFEDSVQSWLPRKIDVAMAIERFALIHQNKDTDALISSQNLLEAYTTNSAKSPFENPGDLKNILQWLSLRSFCLLNELRHQGQPIPSEEWEKHRYLFEHAQTRHNLLKKIEQPFLK